MVNDEYNSMVSGGGLINSSKGKRAPIDIIRSKVLINTLTTRGYFGEIALITKLKRTATVKSTEYCTFSTLSRETMDVIKGEYPQIYLNFRRQVFTYRDEDMLFRKEVIKNIPYLRGISEELALELVCLLREQTYERDSMVVKHGHISDRVYIVWRGNLKVELFYNDKDHLFDKLNKGSCFCVFSAFSDDYTQIFNFKVTSAQAVILSFKSQDLVKLSRSNLELADIIKQLQIQIKHKQKNNFDFFRYYQLKEGENVSFEHLRQIRLKFRRIFLRIYRLIRDKVKPMPETLQVIQQIYHERKVRDQLLKKIMLKKDAARLLSMKD